MHYYIALLHLDGELYLALIREKPSRILDLGTGTGIWAIDIGDKFEDATVRSFTKSFPYVRVLIRNNIGHWSRLKSYTAKLGSA